MDFKTNSSLMGITLGGMWGKGSHGFYVAIRSNPLLFSRNYKNERENGNFFATAGYCNQILYPLGFYIGFGFAIQQTINDNHFRFNPELGLNFTIANRVLIRGGINIPAFVFKHDNIYYSIGIGYKFLDKKQREAKRLRNAQK